MGAIASNHGESQHTNVSRREGRGSSRLMFVHIPRTAGTSLSAFLECRFPFRSCVIHAEGSAAWRDPQLTRDLLDSRFITGHMRLAELESRVGEVPHVTLTVLREPLTQTRSHLNWMRDLAEPGRERSLGEHEPLVQGIATRMREEGMSRFLRTLEGYELHFFDNCQTRYLTMIPGAEPVRAAHLQSALDALERYDIVGHVERYRELLACICWRMGWRVPAPDPRRNSTRIDHLAREGIAANDDALEELVRHDKALYGRARALFDTTYGALAAELNCLAETTAVEREVSRRGYGRYWLDPARLAVRRLVRIGAVRLRA